MSDMTTTSGATSLRTARVKAVFEEPHRYLSRWKPDIRIRRESVEAYAASFHFKRLLDIGCGDGSISLPLAGKERHLMLLDLSASMTALAASKVPPELATSVEVLNGDVMAMSFGGDPLDLIVCIGVLAHVDSPDAFAGKIASLLESNGHLIVEFTDSYHFCGRLNHFFSRIRQAFAPARSSLNLFSADTAVRLMERHGFRLVSEFRYCQLSLPGLRFIGDRFRYWIVRFLFGTAPKGRNGCLGNEYICLFRGRSKMGRDNLETARIS